MVDLKDTFLLTKLWNESNELIEIKNLLGDASFQTEAELTFAKFLLEEIDNVFDYIVQQSQELREGNGAEDKKMIIRNAFYGLRSHINEASIEYRMEKHHVDSLCQRVRNVCKIR